MSERSELIAWVRGELVGPSRPLAEPAVIEMGSREFVDSSPSRRGPVAWRSDSASEAEEVLYYDRESPHRKYGAGLLHPVPAPKLAASAPLHADQAALLAGDTVGAEVDPEPEQRVDDAGDDADDDSAAGGGTTYDASEDFEVTSPDVRHPSTVGISFCARLEERGRIVVRLPRMRRFGWQDENSPSCRLNGRYESCKRRWTDERGRMQDGPMWRRHPAVLPGCEIAISRSDLVTGLPVRRDVTMPEGSPLNLRVEVFHDTGNRKTSGC